MLELSNKDIRRLSKLGPRATYGEALLKLIEENANVYALSADLGGSSGLQRLMRSYPERYLNVGIAEQNMIGIAGGMAKEGLIPYVSSFAPFISMRSCEQVKMNMGYMKLNIKAVALGSGISMSDLGNSHYGIEDVAIMRAIPNITIISPADCAELAKVVWASAEVDKPIYIRMTGVPGGRSVYEDDFEYIIGKNNILREGKDCAILATGSMVAVVLDAANILKDKGVDCTVVDFHTIKPLEYSLLDYITKKHTNIVTVEEHTVIGGFGSSIAEYLSENYCNIKLMRLGLPDSYLKVGDYSYMLEQYGLTAESVSCKITDFLR